MLSTRFVRLLGVCACLGALPVMAAPPESGKPDVKRLISGALEGYPGDPINASILGERLAKDPKTAVETVGVALKGLDWRKDQDWATVQEEGKASRTVQRGIHLLSSIIHEESLSELDKLHERAKDNGRNSKYVRYEIVHALASNHLGTNRRPITLMEAEPEKAIVLLEKWLKDEEDKEILAEGLLILSRNAAALPPWLVKKAKDNLPERAVNQAERRVRINAAKDYKDKVREALAWIDVLIEEAASGMYDYGDFATWSGPGAPAHFIYYGLRRDLMALKFHAQEFEEKVRRIDKKLAEIEQKIKADPPAKQLKLLETAKEDLTTLKKSLTDITEEVKPPSREK